MNSGGVKILLSFALFGFIAGMLIFLVFDNFLLSILSTKPLLKLITTPLFISGIIGSILSITIVLTFAHFTRK